MLLYSQSRLSRFSGATAISSDAYWNREGDGGRAPGPGPNGGAGADITASELVNRLSFHVRGATLVDKACQGSGERVVQRVSL
jgi:hypothetical protein